MSHRRRRKAAAADSDEDDEVIVRYVKPNTIYYRGEIREPEATHFCIKLRKAAAQKLPVTVFLSSHGGDAYAGVAMYEHVCDVKRGATVNVIADGYVASAATLPLLAASNRIMCRNATLLVHAVTSYTWGGYKPKQLKEEAENLDTLMNILHNIYRRHSTMKKKELDRLLDKDRLLTFDECKAYGFVDGDLSVLT